MVKKVSNNSCSRWKSNVTILCFGKNIWPHYYCKPDFKSTFNKCQRNAALACNTTWWAAGGARPSIHGESWRTACLRSRLGFSLHSNTRRNGDPHWRPWEERGGADASSWHEGAGNLPALTENERSPLDHWMNFDLWEPKAYLMFVNKSQKFSIKLKTDVYSDSAKSLRSLKKIILCIFLSNCYLICYFQSLQHLQKSG